MRNTYLTILLSLFTIVVTAQTNVPPYVPLGSLRAWWPFSGNAIDSSGTGNHGTVHGCTLTTDRFGAANSAYHFDGVTNFIHIDPSVSLELTKSVTIAAWVKSHNYPASSQAQIFWRGDLSSAHDPYMLYFNSGEVLFRRDLGPTGATITEIGYPTSIMDTTKWHHIVGTYNIFTGVMKVYYDGFVHDTAHLPGDITYALPTYWNEIGSVDNGTWQFFNGSIDDVGAWERELTACEVNKLYMALPTLITAHPKNDTVDIAGTATFAISDTGVGAPSYQWQENSGAGFVNLTNTPPYSGVDTKTLVISPASLIDSGNLYRCIRNINDICVDTSDASRLFVGMEPDSSITLGIAASNNYLDVSLVPNPNNGEFTIKGICTNGGDQISIEITNMLGQVVYETKTAVQNRKINQHFSLKNMLNNGVYLLRAHSTSASKVLQVVISE